jgi:hypothetical protein
MYPVAWLEDWTQVLPTRPDIRGHRECVERIWLEEAWAAS